MKITGRGFDQQQQNENNDVRTEVRGVGGEGLKNLEVLKPHYVPTTISKENKSTLGHGRTFSCLSFR